MPDLRSRMSLYSTCLSKGCPGFAVLDLPLDEERATRLQMRIPFGLAAASSAHELASDPLVAAIYVGKTYRGERVTIGAEQ